MNSRSATATPAATPIATASPIWPIGFVDLDHNAAAPPIARTVERAATGPSGVITPRQRPPSTHRPRTVVASRITIRSDSAIRRHRRLVTAHPASAPSTLDTRRREWPPPSFSSGSNGTPSVISSRTRAGPSSTRTLTALGRQRSRPARSVSIACRPAVSSSPIAPAIPPWACQLDASALCPLVSINPLEPCLAVVRATVKPAAPEPTTSTSHGLCGTLWLAAERDRPAVGSGVLLGRACLPGPVNGHAPILQRGPVRATAAVMRNCPPAGVGKRLHRGPAVNEARPFRWGIVYIDDRVRQSTGPVDDDRSAVSQSDHLALSARLKSGWHHVQVYAGVDAAGQVSIEGLHYGDGLGKFHRHLAQVAHELGLSHSQSHQAGPGGHQFGRGTGQQVEALLWIEPTDHAQNGARIVRIEAQLCEQGLPALCLAGQLAPRVVGRKSRVRCRIPDGHVEPIKDAAEPVAPTGKH